MRNKIILALDVSVDRAKGIVEKTKGLVEIYKIGPILWHDWGKESLSYFKDQNVKIMMDFKFHDIPSTVKESLTAIHRLDGSEVIWGLTLHCLGGFAMLRSAVLERDSWPKTSQFQLFGVTVLTSLKEGDLYRVGINRTVEAQVKKLAVLAQDAGLEGVVASGHEAAGIHKACGRQFLVLVPGIRLNAELKKDLDHKRVLGPLEALGKGADYLIVGREIYTAEDPKERLEALIGAIETLNK